MIYPRKPRFRRSSDIASIELTERDEKIIRFIHRHRFLRSSHLAELVDGSRQQLLRRLQALYHHGYLERPLCQLDYFQKGGSHSMVYGLGSKGAAFLRRVDNILFSKIDWSGKNQSVRRVFLDHALMVSDIMVSFELACRKRGDVKLLIEIEIPLPATTLTECDPFRWTVAIPGLEKFGVIPDRVFALEIKDKKELIICFLEADRGTMPLKRIKQNASSIWRKMHSYALTWKYGIHRSRFGVARVRVLTVTDSKSRCEKICQVASEISGGLNIFLQTYISTECLSSEVLSKFWFDISGQKTSLIK